jgi:hypothetical protein
MNKITNFQIFLSVVFCMYLQSCTAQETITSSDYEACCGSKSVERTIGRGNTYVPNVFTPNGDGTNDHFRPFVSEGLEAQAFTIYSAVGDTILYTRSYFGSTDTKTNLGWDGFRKDGTAYKGIFKYGIAIYAENNIREEITGEACCVRCEPSATILKSKDGCFYPIQADNKGHLDKSIAASERECF